jgi:hypothetical protein
MTDYLFQIRYADGRVEERNFRDGSWRIGRESGDVVLRDPSVSGAHGELRLQAGTVTYADLGSSNGSFDLENRRLSAPLALSPGRGVKLGSSIITLLRAGAAAPLPVAAAPAVFPPTQAMPQMPQSPPAPPAPPAPAPVPVALAPVTGGLSRYSHPEQAVRHSYPLAIKSAGIGEAMGLLLKTMPFLLVRLGILAGLSIVGLIWWALLIGGLIFFSKISSVLGWGWFIALAIAGGWIWRGVVRYFLYLIKAAHIAVLTELVTTGQIGNGSESMFEYGKRIVKERFGEVNVMFGLDLLIDGIVGAFNRTLNWVSSLIPVPGLDSIMGVVNAILKASTTYIDETIFSYNLARGDENVFRSSKDGLIYYAQNAKEILKTGIWVVVLEKVLTAVTWVVMLIPVFVIGSLIPSSPWLTFSMFVVAAVFAADIRSAFLKPLFLTMVMIKFHATANSQAINPEWDARLSDASDKFRELKQKADGWLSPGSAPAPGRAAQPV